MHLAYFSPLNPQPSGISDYSEELLPYLAAQAEITLFVDGFEPSNPQIRARFAYHDYRRNRSILKTLNDYDAVVYHLGNDHRYHASMLEVARAHAGIVVFHDFALQDFFLGLAQERGRPELYLEEVFACHGYEATRDAAEALERGSTPPLVALPTDFPLNCRLARAAEAIIVHSEWSRARFARSTPAVPVAHINMPIKPPLKTQPDSKETTAVNGVVQIANFGLITPGKGIEKALRALSSLKADHDFHYTLVGEPNSFFDVRALVRKYDMDDRVTITGHVQLNEFERRIGATDIALNLRERTVGETSASLCRIMAAGVPAVVFNVGAFSELPSDAVVKLDHDEHAAAMLEAYLRRLIEDAPLRRRIGDNARRYIVEHHDIETSAASYLEFIRQVIALRPRKQFLGSVADQVTALGIRGDADVLSGVAEEVAALVPLRAQVSPGAPALAGAETSGLAQRSWPRESADQMSALPANDARSAEAAPLATEAGRMPALPGVDYKRAALEYPQLLDAERSYYLRTKPFYNLAHKPAKHTGYGMDPETHRHFSDFANMAVALALPAGARMLDVGCGSGWLSEYFARLGYDVTGIDISDDLIGMARERVASVPYHLDHESAISCRFITHDIETAPLAKELGAKFDAIICYDSLHHLLDERAVFRHLAAMLDVGGLLFILEGHKPAAGSATEDELSAVMREYGTLESPFSTDYLRRLLDQHGFAVVGDYVSVNGLFEREMLEGAPFINHDASEAAADSEASEASEFRLPLRTIATDYHYLTCMKVATGAPAKSVPDSRAPSVLRAEFTLRETPPPRVAPGTKVEVLVDIRNTGDTLWLTGQTVRAGVVMPGLKILDEDGGTVLELHGHPLLPRAVAPGQSVALDLQFVAPDRAGKYTVKIDLVDQHVCWFEERGSRPLLFSFEVKRP
jgi:glycosyltransferase involved in cell wall biosynthesis/SAM-dependent methyltransferase